MELVLLNPSKTDVQAKIDECKDYLACVQDPETIRMHEKGKFYLGCKRYEFGTCRDRRYPISLRAFAKNNGLDLNTCIGTKHVATPDIPCSFLKKPALFAFWELHDLNDEQLADQLRPEVRDREKRALQREDIKEIGARLKKRKLSASGKHDERRERLLEDGLEELVKEEIVKLKEEGRHE